MKPRPTSLALGIVAISMLLVCSACTRPYKNPVLDPPGTEFIGAIDLIDRYGTVEIVSMHGMCTHGEEWAKKTVDRISTATPELTRMSTSESTVSGVKLYKTNFVDSGNKVRLTDYAFVWSGLTAAPKRSLCYDSDIVTPSCQDPSELSTRKRGSINSALKSNLMNDCFADALIYLGPQGPEIRQAIRDAVDAVLSDGQGDSDKTLVLISESLGSKVLADSLTEETDDKAGRLQLFAPTELVFMAANQIPILSLADEDHDKSGTFENSLQEFLFQISEQRDDKRAGDLQVIAFTDPNDLLSYELKATGFSASNVFVSNDKTWFGKLERPDTAHRNYLENDKVWQLILCGSSGGC